MNCGSDAPNNKRDLIGFADADWAQNTIDRKSNSGFIFQFFGATISWSCKKQTSVALSLTEAEYVALVEATQESLWIHRLLKDFGETTAKIVIYEDSQSCLNLVSNNKFSNRTKHIDTRFHFIRDMKDKKIVDYRYCLTDEMLTDMLTKPLGKVKYMTGRCG